jgi:hypothetical protein
MKRKKPPEKQYYCRDCVHATEHHNRSFATGENIMARCEKSGFDVLLRFEACKDFKGKQ